MSNSQLMFVLGAAAVLPGVGASYAEAPVSDPLSEALRTELREFGAAYSYDTGYLEKLLEDSPPAYQALSGAQGMSEYRKVLPVEAHFVARVATMLVEDCGPCTQLNLRMAVEAGVDRSTLETLLHRPAELPEGLNDVYEHARAVVGAGELDPDRAERLRGRYGDEGFAELAVVITGCRIYPTLKRAMLANEKCIVGELDF